MFSTIFVKLSLSLSIEYIMSFPTKYTKTSSLCYAKEELLITRFTVKKEDKKYACLILIK